MTVLKRPFRILILAIIGSSMALAHVGEVVTLAGDLFGRSSANFISQENIQSVVPNGSTATVLETRTLPSGSIGVRVKINSVGSNRGSQTANAGDEVWIYHSKSQPWFSLDGSASRRLDDEERVAPLVTSTVRANLDIGEDPNLARTSNRHTTEGGFCADCDPYGISNPSKKNQQELRKVIQKPTSSPVVLAGRIDPNSPWARFPEVQRYENNPVTQRMINSARNNAEPHSTRYCYRYVKNALLNSGMIRSRPDGNANEAVKGLKSKGMINMLDNPQYRAIINGDPRKAPKGAIIIYGNDGPKPPYWGDTQIKTSSSYSNSQFISDFVSSNTYLTSPSARKGARDGHPYRVVGVMIKP